MVFLKEAFERVNFEKKSVDGEKHAKFPACNHEPLLTAFSTITFSPQLAQSMLCTFVRWVVLFKIGHVIKLFACSTIHKCRE